MEVTEPKEISAESKRLLADVKIKLTDVEDVLGKLNDLLRDDQAELFNSLDSVREKTHYLLMQVDDLYDKSE